MTAHTCCLLVAVAVMAAGVEAMPAEEILFERKLSEEEREHFTLFTFQKDVSKYATIEEIREIYTQDAKVGLEDRQLVKIVLVYDEATRKGHYVSITKRAVKRVETLYERELPKEDVECYLEGAYTMELPDGMSLQEIRKKYGTAYWDKKWGIKRVDLWYAGAYRGEYDKSPRLHIVYLRAGSRVKTAAEKRAEAEWVEGAKKRLAVNQDAKGWKHLESTFELLIGDDAEFTGMIPLGKVEESFEKPEAQRLLATVEEWAGELLPDHEALRRIMGQGLAGEKVGLEKSRAGYVLVKRARLPGPGALIAGSGPRSVDVLCAAWISGRTTIFVEATNCSLKSILELYGEKLPSTLSKKVNMDIAGWYRDEVELILARAHAHVVAKERARHDWFSCNILKLCGLIKLPDELQAKILATARETTSDAEREAVYRETQEWWVNNKGALTWNINAKLLTKKGEKLPGKFD